MKYAKEWYSLLGGIMRMIAVFGGPGLIISSGTEQANLQILLRGIAIFIVGVLVASPINNTLIQHMKKVGVGEVDRFMITLSVLYSAVALTRVIATLLF